VYKKCSVKKQPKQQADNITERALAFFVNRLVKQWNSLPDDVVSACSVSSFKRCLDLLWHGFSLYYDYKSVI